MLEPREIKNNIRNLSTKLFGGLFTIYTVTMGDWLGGFKDKL